MTWSPLTNSMVLLGLLVLLLLVHWLAWRLTDGLLRHGRSAAERLPRSAYWSRLRRAGDGLYRRQPRLSQWLAARLDWHRFTGLPLTLLVLLGAWLFALLAGLVEELLSETELQQLDDTFNAWLQPLRGQPLLAVFAWFTALGAAPAMTGLTVFGSAFFWAYRRLNLLPGLWLTLLGSQLTTWSGKYLFGRERPEFVAGVTEPSPSFPSGHATIAIAVLGFLIYALTREPLTSRARFELVYWGAVLIVLIGGSRLFLSVHYLSDVAAGFLVGGFWLLAGIILSEYLRHRVTASRSGPLPERPR